MLVFFDDILVYSQDKATHLQPLAQVFELMLQHQMFAKVSKCSFGMKKVEYPGNLISAEGVQIDPKKIELVAHWPISVSLKELRSFLGLCGYYRKFVKNYAQICRPLNDLLKKGAFIWSDNATAAFNQLKTTLISSPLLAVPNFNKNLLLKLMLLIWVLVPYVLMPEGHPLAYISRTLGPKWQKLSIYENNC